MILLIVFVVLFILVVVSVKSVELRSQLEGYVARQEELEAEKADQEERARELEDLEKEVKTKGYAEKVARDQLGLVYEDEIQFIEEK